MYRLLAILCFLAPLPGVAQTLKGRVTEKGSGQPLYPVTVVNLSTQKSTYSNPEGYFTIQAVAGDKVAFSYIGYKAAQYQMPISVGVYTADINLEAISYRLQEVILMPDYTQYQIDSIENVKTYRPFLSRSKSSVLGSPFSFVAEKFNKRSKQIFKFQKKFNQWEDARFIDTRYTPELVAEMTGMQGDSLGHFMNAYPMPYDYARAATDLEMKMWIRYHYREWLKVIDSTGIPRINDSLVEQIKE
ncbi:MAG: carboxypeptidase-like regulatory domain-containing protein [Chitinophagales bacterium]|nr:carboxypeptidase-like regulatory domain-containing protein [Chitinophagales bacterium]